MRGSTRRAGDTSAGRALARTALIRSNGTELAAESHRRSPNGARPLASSPEIWQRSAVDSLVMIDGQIVAAERATVSVFDRGFLYGDSVFETLATRGGKAVDLGAHVDRLAKSAAQVFIDVPVSPAVIEAEVRHAIAVSEFGECTVRIMVTRGKSDLLGLDPGLAEAPLRVVLVVPQKRPPEELYQRGIAAITFRTQRTAEATDAAGAKVGNYLVAVLAMRAARAANAHEALVLDSQGNIVEGATSNIFVVVGGCLITPPEESGILPGITRARIIEIAAELGLPMEYRLLSPAMLAHAEEAFISSSIREILPVVNVDGVPVGSGRPGPMTRRLLAEYQRRAALAAR